MNCFSCGKEIRGEGILSEGYLNNIRYCTAKCRKTNFPKIRKRLIHISKDKKEVLKRLIKPE